MSIFQIQDPNLRQLRDTTTAQRNLKLPASPRHRKSLKIEETPTLVRTLEHNCYQVEPKNTEMKIIQRIWNTFFRMQVAFIFGCKTWRGTTRLNGAISHCDCQSAHSSLSPTLYDDMLDLVISRILKHGFDQLTPISKKYVSHRFDLASPVKLPFEAGGDAEQCLGELTRKLSARQKKGSFVDTEMEKCRNATFENPCGSNRLDSHLEHHLRSLEDQLADVCSKKEKDACLATQELASVHINLLEEAMKNIKVRQLEFEAFLNAHSELNNLKLQLDPLVAETTSLELYASFIEKADHFLALKKQLLKDLPGAPHLNDFVRYFLKQTPYYQLSVLIKGYKKDPSKIEPLFLYHEMKHQIHLTPLIENVEIRKADFESRYIEAQMQLQELRNLYAHIPAFPKAFFGVVDKTGQRHSPTKEQIADQLIEQTHSVKRKLICDLNDNPPQKKRKLKKVS